MSHPNYKLIYFNTKGLGEGIRYLFHHANIPFEDCRIDKADWPALKEKMPYGTLPVLEVDGVMLNQTTAIMRFFGEEYGYVVDEMQLEADLETVVDDIKDVQIKMKAASANKTRETEKTASDALTVLLTKLEKITKNGCFHDSKKLTWIEFYFTGLFDAINDRIPNVLKPFPNLTELTERIKNNENVQKYIKQRPPPCAM